MDGGFGDRYFWVYPCFEYRKEGTGWRVVIHTSGGKPFDGGFVGELPREIKEDTMSKVREELEQLTKMKQKQGQDLQEYLKNLLVKADEVIGDDEGLWESLSEDTRNWIDESIEVLNAGGKELPDFPDEEDKEEVEETVEEESEGSVKKEESKEEVLIEEKDEESEELVKPAESGDEVNVSVGDKESATTRLCEIVCVNPDLKPSQVRAVLEDEGYSMGITTCRVEVSRVKRVLSLLRKIGKLKEDV